MHSTHTQGMRGGLGVGFRWRCKIIVTAARSPPSTPAWGQCSSDAGNTGVRTVVGECGIRKIWLRKGPGGSKGDTEGPCVSLPNHCVALWGQRTRGRFLKGGGEEGRGGKPEHKTEVIRRRGRGGRRGGEEVSRLTTTDVHRQHSSECKPPHVTFYINSLLSAVDFLP